jgi:holin-like protein
VSGVAILFAFQFAGYLIQHFTRIPIPANVIGMILLVIALFAGWVKLEWIERPAQFLLRHMLIFFAPTIVGTIVFFPRIGQEWLAISISLIVSTLLTLLLTGWLTERFGGERGAAK